MLIVDIHANTPVRAPSPLSLPPRCLLPADPIQSPRRVFSSYIESTSKQGHLFACRLADVDAVSVESVGSLASTTDTVTQCSSLPQQRHHSPLSLRVRCGIHLVAPSGKNRATPSPWPCYRHCMYPNRIFYAFRYLLKPALRQREQISPCSQPVLPFVSPDSTAAKTSLFLIPSLFFCTSLLHYLVHSFFSPLLFSFLILLIRPHLPYTFASSHIFSLPTRVFSCSPLSQHIHQHV